MVVQGRGVIAEIARRVGTAEPAPAGGESTLFQAGEPGTVEALARDSAGDQSQKREGGEKRALIAILFSPRQGRSPFHVGSGRMMSRSGFTRGGPHVKRIRRASRQGAAGWLT